MDESLDECKMFNFQFKWQKILLELGGALRSRISQLAKLTVYVRIIPIRQS